MISIKYVLQHVYLFHKNNFVLHHAEFAQGVTWLLNSYNYFLLGFV